MAQSLKIKGHTGSQSHCTYRHWGTITIFGPMTKFIRTGLLLHQKLGSRPQGPQSPKKAPPRVPQISLGQKPPHHKAIFPPRMPGAPKRVNFPTKDNLLPSLMDDVMSYMRRQDSPTHCLSTLNMKKTSQSREGVIRQVSLYIFTQCCKLLITLQEMKVAATCMLRRRQTQGAPTAGNSSP